MVYHDELAIVAFEFVYVPRYGDWEVVQCLEDVCAGSCAGINFVRSFLVFYQLSSQGVLVSYIHPS